MMSQPNIFDKPNSMPCNSVILVCSEPRAALFQSIHHRNTLGNHLPFSFLLSTWARPFFQAPLTPRILFNNETVGRRVASINLGLRVLAGPFHRQQTNDRVQARQHLGVTAKDPG